MSRNAARDQEQSTNDTLEAQRHDEQTRELMGIRKRESGAGHLGRLGSSAGLGAVTGDVAVDIISAKRPTTAKDNNLLTKILF